MLLHSYVTEDDTMKPSSKHPSLHVLQKKPTVLKKKEKKRKKKNGDSPRICNVCLYVCMYIYLLQSSWCLYLLILIFIFYFILFSKLPDRPFYFLMFCFCIIRSLYFWACSWNYGDVLMLQSLPTIGHK